MKRNFIFPSSIPVLVVSLFLFVLPLLVQAAHTGGLYRRHPTTGLNCAPDGFACSSGTVCRTHGEINGGSACAGANEELNQESCGCVCSAGFVRCAGACQRPEPPGSVGGCQPGQSYDPCTGCTGNAYVVLRPSPSGQSGFLSVTGTTAAQEVAAPPAGSLFFNTERGKLRVKTGAGADTWQDVGGASYTADRNISIDTNNRIAVKPNPTFDNLKITGTDTTVAALEFATETSGDKLSLAGNTSRIGATNMFGFGVRSDAIYQKSSKVHQWYSATNADGSSYVMQLDRDSDDQDTHLTVRGGAGRLAEVILRDGADDRWALSSRDSSPNFEIWRNNSGWLQALKIDYNNGAVTIPGFLSISNSVTVSGDVSFNGRAAIGKTLSIGAGDHQAERSLLLANARYSSLGADEYLMELRTTSDTNVPTQRFKIDRDGNIRTTGNFTAGGDIASSGSVTVSDDLTVRSVAVVDNDESNITDSGGGVLKVGRVTPVGGASLYLRLDKNEISSFNGTLYLNAHNDFLVKTGKDFEVDGVIKAGSGDIQITSTGGGLKMAELANEDFDSASKGFMILGAKDGTTCTTVCNNHGLQCDISFLVRGGSFPSRDCSSTESVRNCFCKG